VRRSSCRPSCTPPATSVAGISSGFVERPLRSVGPSAAPLERLPRKRFPGSMPELGPLPRSITIRDVGPDVTVVVDASVVVSALVDGGAAGRWSEERLRARPIAAPHLLPVDVANILRRAALRGDISGDTAALAHADLQDLRIELFPYALVAERAWELRENLTVYDAWYVALAELLGAELATLDERLARAPGPTCRFALFPGHGPLP